MDYNEPITHLLKNPDKVKGIWNCEWARDDIKNIIWESNIFDMDKYNELPREVGRKEFSQFHDSPSL